MDRIRFGGELDRCGRPIVGRWLLDAHGEHHQEPVCEGCRDEFLDSSWAYEPATSDDTRGNGYWVACECACGHTAGARIEEMDRSGRHLRCPACVGAGHAANERTPESFASDPRVRRPQ